MKTITDFIRREPVRVRYLVRLALYLGFTLWAGATLSPEVLLELVLGVVGVAVADGIGAETARNRVTPVESPNLTPSEPIPKDLHQAALAVADLLPAPVALIVKTAGVEGLRLAVETAQRSLERAPTPDETRVKALEGL